MMGLGARLDVFKALTESGSAFPGIWASVERPRNPVTRGSWYIAGLKISGRCVAVWG